MLNNDNIKNRIFAIKSETDFNNLALEIFHFQLKHNVVYQQFVSNLPIDITSVKNYTQIPCLPISFFKTQKVVCGEINSKTICFTSSGSTGQTVSKHYVNDIFVYETAFAKGFELFYGKPSDYCILALLPNYLERTGSSLVYMFDNLIKQSQHPDSGFYLNNLDELLLKIEQLKKQPFDSAQGDKNRVDSTKKQKTILLGVTYALLDLAELNCKLNPNFIVMETGGMKGKREEMVKQELHALLKQKLNVDAVHSEYGMTELLSQAYSKGNGVFECPPWMRVLIRDRNDPFVYQSHNKSGGINVIDLANINSCSFIETQDLGKLSTDNTFEVIGRFDNSDLRGCNLMIQ